MNRAVRRVDRDVQVVERHVPPGPAWRLEGPAQRVRPRECLLALSQYRLERPCDESDHENQSCFCGHCSSVRSLGYWQDNIFHRRGAENAERAHDNQHANEAFLFGYHLVARVPIAHCDGEILPLPCCCEQPNAVVVTMKKMSEFAWMLFLLHSSSSASLL